MGREHIGAQAPRERTWMQRLAPPDSSHALILALAVESLGSLVARVSAKAIRLSKLLFFCDSLRELELQQNDIGRRGAVVGGSCVAPERWLSILVSALRQSVVHLASGSRLRRDRHPP